MAKKKVNIEIPRSGAAAEVPSGDVNIVYNNVRIAGLSETVDATLKTGGTIVQHDIEVEYIKSTPQALTIPIYTSENLSLPVFFTNVQGVPGSIQEFNITQPNNLNDAEIKWDNNNAVMWKVRGNGTPTLQISGYMPNEIPAGATRIIVSYKSK